MYNLYMPGNIMPESKARFRAISLILLFIVTGPCIFGASSSYPGNSAGATSQDARNMVLKENFKEAISVYSQLISKDTTDVYLNSEFSYALALAGVYDAALFNLDKIRKDAESDPEINFYAAQVLSLMGYEQLSAEFEKTVGKISIPGWIASKAPEFILKYKRTAKIDDSSAPDRLVSMFKQANYLTAQNFTLQSIAMFEEITISYPGEYLPYLGYSIALERAGMYERSAIVVEQALVLVNENPLDTATKQVLDERLASIQNNILKEKAGIETAAPGIMAYGGGYVSSSYTSVAAKFGIYYSAANYAAVEMGFASAGGNNYLNLGLTTYKREKIFVVGAGLTSNLGGGVALFYGKISVGLSFMNKKNTSSFDIFLDGKVPLKKGYSTTVGLSIGQSIYFGNRK